MIPRYRARLDDQVSLSALRGIFGGFEEKRRTKRRKRDSSAAQADSFAGANEKKKRRPTSVGMTVGRSCWDTEWEDFSVRD
jgi:hypothetical protein